MSKRENLTGRKFGRLTVVSLVGPDQHGCIVWKCQCECGVEKNFIAGNLRKKSRSCGCLRKEVTRENRTTHGCSCGVRKTKEYQSWSDMKKRCYNPKNSHYKYYGGRGITVCERWVNSFENFLADMGRKQSVYLLDRIDNDKGYFFENCRWVTTRQSAENRRYCIPIEFNGKKMLLSQFCRELGLERKLIECRIKRLGWSVQRALSTPVMRSPKTQQELFQ